MRDLRLAIRSLLKAPVFSVAIIATLALGLGLNTAFFAIFDSLLLKPLQVPDARDLYKVSLVTASGEKIANTPDIYYRIEGSSEPFTAATAQAEMMTSLDGHPARGLLVSNNYLASLNAGYASGRGFLETDGPAAVVLSYRSWDGLFGHDEKIVGRSVQLQGHPFRIVGVTRASFSGLGTAAPDFWIPMRCATKIAGWPPVYRWQITGLLAPHLAREQAEAMLSGAGVRAHLTPAIADIPMAQNLKIAVIPLLVAFVLVMLTPCVNAANLIVARSVSRQRETGIRLALGASKIWLLRPIVCEGLIIAVTAAVLGLCLAQAALAYGLDFLFRNVPAAAVPLLRSTVPDIAIGLRGVVFAFAASALSTLGISMIPAFRAVGRVAAVALRRGIGDVHSSRARSILLTGQVAVCVLLVTGAGVLVETAKRLSATPVGYDSDVVYTFESTAPFDRAGVARELARQPWAASVAFASDARPGSLRISSRDGSNERSGDENDVLWSSASAEYFRTAGIRTIQGRVFRDEDMKPGAAVAIVSASTAHILWNGVTPVGKTFELDNDSHGADIWSKPKPENVTIVGVVNDIASRHASGGMDRLRVYLPGTGDVSQKLLVRIPGERQQAVNRLTAILNRAGPSGTGFVVYSLGDFNAMDTIYLRLVSSLALLLGVVALVLTASGLLGVLMFLTAQRTREIGIRIALGAGPGSIVWLILKWALCAAAIGAVTGGAAAAGIVSAALPQAIIANVLRSVKPYVPALIAVMATVCLGAVGPVVRALSMRPASVLRED